MTDKLEFDYDINAEFDNLVTGKAPEKKPAGVKAGGASKAGPVAGVKAAP
jgi:hypothetical protein